jgi:NAD(P)H-hydrate epimerase
MNYYLPAQCVELDRLTQKTYGISATKLMEHAGKACSEHILKEPQFWDSSSSAIVFCGPGNNGGDGLVISRCLLEQGKRVKTIHVIPTHGTLSQAVRHHLGQLNKHPNKQYCPIEPGSIESIQSLCPPESVHLAVDAIFGTGVRETFDDFWLSLFDWINRTFQHRVAIDHPSGFSSEDGFDPEHPFIQAELTCSIGIPKLAQHTQMGRLASGHVVICPNGFPEEAIQTLSPVATGLDASWARDHMPIPYGHEHKNLLGHLALIAGSQHMPGALALATQAALACGVGKITVFYTQPRDLQAFQSLLPPEAMYLELVSAESFHDHIRRKNIGCVLMGPGLDLTGQGMKDLMPALLKSTQGCRWVLDAEVFRCLSERSAINGIPQNSEMVWAGHLGEQRIFFDEPSASAMIKHSLNHYQGWFTHHPNHVWIRKGPGTLVCGSGRVSLNESGNVGLAKGGSGDVLAGMVGAFAAHPKLTLQTATELGVWHHGHAADRLSAKTSVLSIHPSQLIAELPGMFKELYD